MIRKFGEKALSKYVFVKKPGHSGSRGIEPPATPTKTSIKSTPLGFFSRELVHFP